MSSIELSSESECEEDDLITLNGCGIQTVWRFPADLNYCPNSNCRIQFGVRSDAIVHYKKRHAKFAILCPICVKPIISQYPKNFKQHYLKLHPNDKLPYDFSRRARRKSKSSVKKEEKPGTVTNFNVENEDSEVDDLITLNGCGYITQWRFPRDLKQCPTRFCRKVFESRSSAIAHYQETHSHSILCEICNKPIALNGGHSPSNFIDHHRRMHPNTKNPYDFGNYIENVEMTEHDSSETMNEDQKERLCPLKDCHFKWKATVELREHWNRAHSYLRFPEFREESELIYSTTADDENNDSLVSSVSVQRPVMDAEPPSNVYTTESITSGNMSASEPESSSIASTFEPKSMNFSATEPEMLSNDAYMESGSSIQEENSTSHAQDDKDKSDDNLLEPFRSSNIDNSPSSSEDDLDCTKCNRSFCSVAGLRRHSMVQHNIHSARSTRKVQNSPSSSEDDLYCTECSQSFRSVAGLRRHSMIQHNIHSDRLVRRVQKRKRRKSSSLDTRDFAGQLTIKREKMEPESDDENIPLVEIVRANSHNAILLEMECMVVIERMDPTPGGAQADNPEPTNEELIEHEETEQEQEQEKGGESVEAYNSNVVKEEVDENPLDLSICMRQEEDEDVVILSDTEDAPIIISDGDETDIEASDEREMAQQQNIVQRAEREESTDSSMELIPRSVHIPSNFEETENKENEENTHLHRQDQSESIKWNACHIN